MAIQGTVLNIQRFTMHDGPGIRTEFFLKGCPLRCDWCGNPESYNRHIEVGIYQSKCISYDKCASCADVCPDSEMLIFNDTNLKEIDREKCINCLACSIECPSEAIRQWGKSMTVTECMKEALKDKGFYDRSGGGVTVSGGEPLMQSDFVIELFKACKKEGIHTCLESSFYGSWKRIKSLLPHTDLFISDIKLMDSSQHKKYTRVDNRIILDNLKKLSTMNRELILRIPVIPTVNDHIENIQATADFIINEMSGKVRTLQLLSFMRLGEEKYESLGLPYKMTVLEFDRVEFQNHVRDIAKYFNDRGIHCLVGTREQ